ncbi:MAG: hypothetical protein GEU28_13680 [Dehalococcoidia bacterium]|nr:hypothetical protein [Dehalococcoidia bacterium]
MALVYLLRHAESLVVPESPPEAWELTERGHADARRLAARTEWKDVGAIGSSEEVKSRQTANEISERWGRPLVVDGRFGEVTRPWSRRHHRRHRRRPDVHRAA